MLKTKNILIIAGVALVGILLLSFPVFSNGNHAGNNQTGNLYLNESQLTQEQITKIDAIQNEFIKTTIPLRKKLNLLRTELYNNSLDNNVDIENARQLTKQIRDLQGKIDDLRLDALAKIDKIVPQNRQGYYNNYFNQCWG